MCKDVRREYCSGSIHRSDVDALVVKCLPEGETIVRITRWAPLKAPSGWVGHSPPPDLTEAPEEYLRVVGVGPDWTVRLRLKQTVREGDLLVGEFRDGFGVDAVFVFNELRLPTTK